MSGKKVQTIQWHFNTLGRGFVSRVRAIMAVRTRRTRPDGRGVRVQKEPEQLTEDGNGGSAQGLRLLQLMRGIFPCLKPIGNNLHRSHRRFAQTHIIGD